MKPFFTTTMSFSVSDKKRLDELKRHRIKYIDIFREGMAVYERRLGIGVKKKQVEAVPVQTEVLSDNVIRTDNSFTIEKKYEI